MFKSILLCLAMTSVMCLNAVKVSNNTLYEITLQNFSFISGIERGMFPVILQPGATFSRGDIAHFEIHANDASHIFDNLRDSDHIVVTWADNDLAITFQS